MAVFAAAFVTLPEVFVPAVAEASEASVSSAPTVAAAMAAAKQGGQRVLVDGLTTETDQTWVNPDGTLSLESALAVVRQRQADGSWADVDLDLEQTEHGIRSVLPVVPVTYAVGGGTTIASTLVNGEHVAVLWDAALPTPMLDGTTATYPDVRPGVDLVLEALRSGFELSFMVKTRPTEPLSLPLVMSLPGGWSANRQSDGSLRIKDGTGAVKGRASAPVMFGAQRDPISRVPLLNMRG